MRILLTIVTLLCIESIEKFITIVNNVPLSTGELKNSVQPGQRIFDYLKDAGFDDIFQAPLELVELMQICEKVLNLSMLHIFATFHHIANHYLDRQLNPTKRNRESLGCHTFSHFIALSRIPFYQQSLTF